MTQGQALYAAIAARLGIDPEEVGTQQAILSECDGRVTQPSLSRVKNGHGNFSPPMTAWLCRRFGVILVPPSDSWEFTLDGDACSDWEGGEQ